MLNVGATLTVLPSSMESVVLLSIASRISPSCYDGLLRKLRFHRPTLHDKVLWDTLLR